MPIQILAILTERISMDLEIHRHRWLGVPVTPPPTPYYLPKEVTT